MVIQALNLLHLVKYTSYRRIKKVSYTYCPREVIREFIIEGKGLTEIDAKIKKRGVAEVRLYYGLKELARYYRYLAKLNKSDKLK